MKVTIQTVSDTIFFKMENAKVKLIEHRNAQAHELHGRGQFQNVFTAHETGYLHIKFKPTYWDVDTERLGPEQECFIRASSVVSINFEQ